MLLTLTLGKRFSHGDSVYQTQSAPLVSSLIIKIAYTLKGYVNQANKKWMSNYFEFQLKLKFYNKISKNEVKRVKTIGAFDAVSAPAQAEPKDTNPFDVIQFMPQITISKIFQSFYFFEHKYILKNI